MVESSDDVETALLELLREDFEESDDQWSVSQQRIFLYVFECLDDFLAPVSRYLSLTDLQLIVFIIGHSFLILVLVFDTMWIFFLIHADQLLQIFIFGRLLVKAKVVAQTTTVVKFTIMVVIFLNDVVLFGHDESP